MTGSVTNGLALRKSNCEETGLRSNRSAILAMNDRMSSEFTVALSVSTVFGATVSAFAMADSTGTDTPSKLGETWIVVLSKRSVTGRSNASVTACAARSGASPPTATPSRTTPSGTTVGTVDVVVVVSVGDGGLSASAITANVPAEKRAVESRARRRSVRRSTSLGVDTRGNDAWIVGDDTVDTAFDQGNCERRLVHGPHVDGDAPVVANPDRLRRHDRPVEGRGARAGGTEPAWQTTRQKSAKGGERRPRGRPEHAAPGHAEAILRIGERSRQPRLGRSEGKEDRERKGADEAALDQAVAAERLDDPALDAAHLDIELNGEAETRDERKRLIEPRRAGRHLRTVGAGESVLHVAL